MLDAPPVYSLLGRYCICSRLDLSLLFQLRYQDMLKIEVDERT